MAHTIRDKSKLLNRVRRLQGQLAAVEKAASVVQAKAAAAANKVAPGEGTVLQWAQWTADQLRQVPTIELFSGEVTVVRPIPPREGGGAEAAGPSPGSGEGT